MSLTTCIRKAGTALRAEDKTAILEAARVNRKAGMSADAAAKAAVQAQIEKVQALIAEAQPQVSTWTDEKPAGLKERAQAMAAKGEPVHQDPGEAPEVATKAVVAEAIKTAADNRDRKPSEMKRGLLRMIDEAIPAAKDRTDQDVQVYESTAPGVRMTNAEQAEYKRLSGAQRDKYMQRLAKDKAGLHQRAAERIGFVTLKVPGDGTFKILNTVDRLQAFRSKVESSAGFKDTTPRLESARVNGYGMRKDPGSPFGVERGSGGPKAVIENMIDDGDPQAAVDYAAARGLVIADVLKGDKVRLSKVAGLTPTAEAVGEFEPEASLPDLIAAYKTAKARERELADAKNVNLSELARAVDATRNARAPLVAKLAEQPALSAMNGNGLRRIVAGSAQKQGQWQLTRFDQNGEPWGDSQYTSQEAAIDDFLREVDIDTLEVGDAEPAAPAPSPAPAAQPVAEPPAQAPAEAAPSRPNIADIKRDATLDKEVSDNGERMTRRQWVERKVADGLKPQVKQEDRIKPMSRMAFFRATNEEQRAHERKIKEAGKKDVYWIGDYEVTKTEHDYAVSLIAAEAAESAAPAPDDPFTALFGTPEQQAAAQARADASRQQAARDKARIRDAIGAEQKRAQAEYDDWAGKVYKRNSTQVDLNGDGPSSQASMSIGAINESRRRNAMEALSKELTELKKLQAAAETDVGVERVLSNLRTLYGTAERIAKDGTGLFKTADEQFQYMLLDDLKFRGPSGKGNVTSNGLSKAMLAAIKPDQGAAPSLRERAEGMRAPPKGEPAAKLAPMPPIPGVSIALAQRAHEGTSFSPERRAVQERESHRAALEDAWSRAARAAGNNPEAIARITEVFKDVADGYSARYNATLQARSRVMSAMITGPARFPVERNRKRMETERKRAEEAQEYLQRGIKRLLRAARGPIDNSPESELESVRLRLTEREELQDTMKAANVALRKGDDAALEDLGFTAEQIADLKKPDFAGRKGFPDYKLTNNNAEIRRLRERLAEAEARVAAAAAGPQEQTRPGVRMVEDAQDDRLRLFFDDKPSEEVRNALKAAAFKWSPNAGAWQRQLTERAKYDAKQVLDKFYPADPAGDLPAMSRRISDEQRAANFSAWGGGAPVIDRELAATRGFKTGEAIVVEAYHGAARPDRVGTVFNPKRATSGPMAFFTSDPTLASSYAQGKEDTSIGEEFDGDYSQWYKVKTPGRRAQDVASSWWSLTPEQRDTIAKLAPRVVSREDDDGNYSIELAEEGHTNGIGNYEYEYRKSRNPLRALVENWLASGWLFNEEQDFLKVLKAAGFPMNQVEFDSPRAKFPFVYKTFIRMGNPLVTSDIPPSTMQALEEAAKRDRSRAAAGGVDTWDKNTRTLREWVAQLKDPERSAYAWTSIPDKVTDVLRSQGYDGIVDWSGKGGGDIVAPVYIPFSEYQIKSALGNKGKFDPSKKDILASRTGPTFPAGFVSPRALSAEVAKITANWDTDLATVKVVNSVEDLPDTIRQAVYNVGAENQVRGLAMPTGDVYLVAENIGSLDEGRFVLFHEVYGHVGMRAFLGDGYSMQMRTLKAANPSLAREADAWFKQYGDAEVQARVDSGMTPEQARAAVRDLAVEEALADRAGDAPAINGWQRLMAALQRALRRMGLGSVADMLEGMSEAETMDLLRSARETVRGQQQAMWDAVPALSRAEGWTIPAAAKAFKRMLLLAESDLAGVLYNWNESELRDDTIVGYPGRDSYKTMNAAAEGGRVTIPKREFMAWLMSDAPFDTTVYGPNIASDEEWVGQIQRLRALAADQPLPAMSRRDDFTPRPEVATGTTDQGHPEFATSKVSIAFPQAAERFEVIPGDGQEVVSYAIMPPDSFDVLGHVELLLENGRPVSLLDIEVYRDKGRGQGVGRAVIEALLAANPDADLNISNIVPEARGFWEQMGVPQQNVEGAYDGTLNWQTYSENNRAAGRDAQGRGGARQAGNAAGTGAREGAAGQGEVGPVFSRTRQIGPVRDRALASKVVGLNMNPDNMDDAVAAIGKGWRIFGASEQDGTLSEIFDPAIVENFARDQLFLLPPDRPLPAFSRAVGKATAQDMLHAKSDIYDFNRMGETRQDRARAVFDKARPFWLGALTRDQIADVYGAELPQVRDYDALVRSMENERSSLAQRADGLYQEWAKLPAEVNDRLARIMLDATVEGVHPDKDDKPIDPGKHQAHALLRAKFKMLDKDAQAMYGKVRDFHSEVLGDIKNGLIERIKRQVAAGAERAALLSKVQAQFDQYLGSGPYFPLHRFGDYLVIATRADGERVVAAYENAGEQQVAARELRAQGFTTKLKTAKEYSRSLDGSAGKFIGDMIAAVDKVEMAEATLNGSRTDLKNQLLDDLNQLFIRALPDLSYRKHFAHRKNTAGFSSDVMRGFASSAFHAASHIARLNHADRMTAALEGAYKAVDDAVDGDFNTRTQVLNELANRHDAMLNPSTHPLAALATQAGFVMYLGLSPAAGLINMLQVPMVSLPYIGARYGFRKASAALATAYKDIMAAAPNRKSGFNAAQSPKLSTEERQAISTLQDEGVIDLTQAHDLASATDRDVGNVARSRASFAVARAMRIVGWTFHVPEVMNRQVTALMAYRLEREKGGSNEVALEAARDAIKRTQFDYSASNRARYFQGNVARVVLQFKQFAQNMTYFLGRAAHQALKGEDPEVRRIARRQILSTFAVTGMMAGSMGMPGVGALGALVGALAGAMGDDDEPWDWQTEYRNMLADAFGKEWGEVFAKGVPRMLMPAWDVSGRVGLSELWWRSNDREGQSPREAFASDLGNILGPSAGTVLGWYTAADHMQRGQYDKAMEAVVPKFIRDPLKAYREATDGITTYNGEPLMDTTAVEEIGRFLGFAPARASEMFEGRNAVMNAKTALEEKRQRLLTAVVKAKLEGDAEAEAEARSEIAGFNERNPEFKITGMTIAKSLATRRRNRENTVEGILLPDTKASLRERARFANLE